MRKLLFLFTAVLSLGIGTAAVAEPTVSFQFVLESADAAKMVESVAKRGGSAEIVQGSEIDGTARNVGDDAVFGAVVNSGGAITIYKRVDDGLDAYARWMANASTEDVKACLSGTEIPPLVLQKRAEEFVQLIEGGADLARLDTARRYFEFLVNRSVRTPQCFPAGDMMRELGGTNPVARAVGGSMPAGDAPAE